jgi:hypothetical protein
MFAIEYKGDFRVKTPGHYKFRLMSDDGARLFIDGKMVIDNDGVHAPSSKKAKQISMAADIVSLFNISRAAFGDRPAVICHTG